MRDGGRLAAAIAVLGDIAARHRPAHLALKAWGDGARYAGAKDRAFVSGLVLDGLRRRRSLAWMMGAESDRACVLAVARFVWAWPAERVRAAASDADHGPGPLTDDEEQRLLAPQSLASAPAPVRGDYSDWLEPLMIRAFGEDRAEEAGALAARAPVDLRVNTLKADKARVLKALSPFSAQSLEATATAIRIAAGQADQRAPFAEGVPGFEKGWFEVQDLGSQVAAAAAGPIANLQVLDFCAGGGGKTLTLAAAMENTGQLYAFDADARRLTDTVRRAQRAGVRNLQVRSPIDPKALDGLEGRMDLVFVDAPCTGSGTWRRRPDAKWRLTAGQLDRRMAEQDAVLDAASLHVRPGGRLIYVTCSLFCEENEDRVAAFLARNPRFTVSPAPKPVVGRLTEGGFLRLTPRTGGTDGFFVAILAAAK
ncbi:MAG TPA: RsmB/NOP family class I SAM-dependent RNA methyltransferase [Caulobacteraceae bacterium]